MNGLLALGLGLVMQLCPYQLSEDSNSCPIVIRWCANGCIKMVLYLYRGWIVPKTAKKRFLSIWLSPWDPYLSSLGSEAAVIGRDTGLGVRNSKLSSIFCHFQLNLGQITVLLGVSVYIICWKRQSIHDRMISDWGNCHKGNKQSHVIEREMK